MRLVGREATELAALVRAGTVSATEVVRAHLDQLAAVEHRLGAFVSTRRGAALDEAAAIDARGDLDGLPLAGVPVAVKDIVDVAGEPTRHGSRAWPSTPATTDSVEVARLRAAGAIVVGKTRAPELSIWGTSDDAEGTAVSPWDPTRSAGGSSGGSAAAVAAGVVPIALASDGLGSVRIPAAACGAVGIRPGAPHLPEMVGGRHHWFGMSRFGPIATSVADVALALDVLAGETVVGELAAPPERLEIAVSWKAPAVGVVVAGPWREAAIEAGRLANHAGHHVVHEDPPYDRATVQAVLARWTQGPAADVEAFDLDRESLQPRTRAHVAAGERLAKGLAVDEQDAVRWRERVVPFLERYDVLITPSFARAQPAAGPWHDRAWTANLASNLSSYPFTAAWNLADVPAMVLPMWQDAGRPLSVQLVAAPGRERALLEVAAMLDALRPRQRHAPGWGVPTGAED
ncbi:MAG: amidase [Nitriliruptoraceae bacterium]|nr:amidase [Nitriliruptoraceae bacterium]